MALTDGVTAQVTGTVGRVDDGRFTIEVKLSTTAQYPDYVTVWKPTFTVATGDRITVRGRFTWKKVEKDGKTYVNVSVNDATILEREQTGPAPTEDWATSAPAEVPF
jgi:uncharacterized protein (DUF736 family)